MVSRRVWLSRRVRCRSGTPPPSWPGYGAPGTALAEIPRSPHVGELFFDRSTDEVLDPAALLELLEHYRRKVQGKRPLSHTRLGMIDTSFSSQHEQGIPCGRRCDKR